MSSCHDEYLYREVLQSVIHPLGAPGTRLGCRPHDLASHLTQVFGFGAEKRQSISSDLQLLKPSNIVVSVQLVEARNLKPNCITDSRDPYCILGVVFAKTPRPSPHSSPNLRMRRKSSYQEDVRKSQTIKGTVCPKWQEEFEFDVHEYYNQALHVIIWDDTSASNPSHEKGGTSEKTSGIKSLFRNLRSSIDQGRGNDDIIGQCRVPLKAIPAGGCDQWFDLYEDRKQKVKRQGQLRLRLQLSIKQDVDQLDSAESDQCSMEDYYHIVRKLYIHALKALSQQAQLEKQRRSLDRVSDTSVESIPQRCKSCDASLLRVSRRFSDTGQLSPPKSLTQCRHSDMQLMTSLDESMPIDRCSVASEPTSLNSQLSDSSPRLSVKSKSTDSILSSRPTPPLFSDASDGDTVTRPCTSTPMPHHFSMTHLNVCRHHQRSSSAVELSERLHHDSSASLRHQCSAPADASTQHCDVSLVLIPASPDTSGCDQVEPPVLQCLPPPSQSILRQFSVQNHFSKVTQVLMELIVIMELVATTTYDCDVSDSLLREKVTKLEAELSLLQPVSIRDSGSSDRGLLTSTELSLFSYTATTYVTCMVDRMRTTPRQVPALFPPNLLDTEALEKSLGILSRLLNLRVWACNKHALQQVSAFLTDILQNDVRCWVQSKLDTLHSNVRDSVIPETKMASTILYDATMTLTPIHSVAQFFDGFDIDYFRLSSLTMESKLATRAQDLTHAMDAYQLRYHKFLMNIRESSKVSLQFYLALQDFLHVIKTNINPRELFKVSLANYQAWFKTTVIFWLQTFRDVCITRMEKALEIEKDVVQVTCLVKYSNSSVDVLSCFSKIITEWMQINFADPDIALLGVTKITDTICDGAVHYAEKIEMILEKNGFYDFIDNQKFDVTEQLCISLNNIEHVRQFLDELPQLLDWTAVTQQMTFKHESEEIGQKALSTLEHLVDGANEDMLMKSRQLLRQIADKMSVDLQTYFAALVKGKPGTTAIDPLLDYLDTNLGMFYERLEASLFPLILEHIWGATIEVFHEMLLVGQSPEYYRYMLSQLQMIEAYFSNENNGTSSSCWTGGALYGQLLEKLRLNGLSSEKLMLLYYKDLAESPQTPREFYGHMGVKIGFIPKRADLVSLHIKVQYASHLPTMKDGGRSDVFVTVSLGPNTLFPFNRPMRTRVVCATSNPVFNEIFHFESIPRSLLSTEGTVVVFSMWQHRTLLPHDFIGEVVLSLGDATEIGRLQTIDDTCGFMMSLKRPLEQHDGPFYVLRERCQRDKVANALVKHRQAMTGGGRALCAPMNFILASMCGNVKNVKHMFS